MSRRRTNERRAARARRCYHCHDSGPDARLRVYLAKRICLACYTFAPAPLPVTLAHLLERSA